MFFDDLTSKTFLNKHRKVHKKVCYCKLNQVFYILYLSNYTLLNVYVCVERNKSEIF